MSLPQLMNLGLSGVPFVGVDIGGFWGNSTPDLFARWMQLATFYPFSRSHSVTGAADKEPWVWGKEVEQICRSALELRYRLMPYLYTLFWEAAQRGWPIFRPLLFHYPSDSTARSVSDQVLFGQDLLVAPVYRPGINARAVYLPDGVWYERSTGRRLTGLSSVIAQADLTAVPIYTRGGAVVPMGPILQHTDERPLDPLTLEIYTDSAGSAGGVLYEDDGHSFEYERGDWCLTRYTYTSAGADGGTLVSERTGAFEPPPRAVEVRVHTGVDGGLSLASRPDDLKTWQLAIRA
jgi:alpha-glucosidase